MSLKTSQWYSFATNYWRPLRPFLKCGGGHIVPPLAFEGCLGVVVSNLSDNLISYPDWHQTKGFTTFRYLEPPQLMVWKSDFFRWSLTLVRVPPYESGVKMTNFQFSWLNGEFLWGQKCSPHFLNQNEELSKKNWRVYLHIHTRIRKYMTGGAHCAPPRTK